MYLWSCFASCNKSDRKFRSTKRWYWINYCCHCYADRLAPSTAAIVQDKVRAYNSVAFDIAAVGSSFLYGMSVASQFIAAGVYDNVLVVVADTFLKITRESIRNWSTIKRYELWNFASSTVEKFDYKNIAAVINEDGPDIIWISLGVPK